MKNKRFTFYTILAIIVVVILWLLFLIIPYFHLIANKIICDSVNAAYVMAGALFTGLAFAATYVSLLMQNKALKEQLAMDTLSNTIDLILDSDRFRESRKYVMSKTFYNHVEILKKMKDDDMVCIEDWKKIVDVTAKDNEKDYPINSYEAYEKIIYFCGRMEYMGVILKNKGIDNTFLDYFGNTIIDSYNRLEPFIRNSRMRFGETYYFHYTYLNYLARKRKPKLKQECKELLEKMSKEKLDFED